MQTILFLKFSLNFPTSWLLADFLPISAITLNTFYFILNDVLHLRTGKRFELREMMMLCYMMMMLFNKLRELKVVCSVMDAHVDVRV